MGADANCLDSKDKWVTPSWVEYEKTTYLRPTIGGRLYPWRASDLTHLDTTSSSRVTHLSIICLLAIHLTCLIQQCCNCEFLYMYKLHKKAASDTYLNWCRQRSFDFHHIFVSYFLCMVFCILPHIAQSLRMNHRNGTQILAAFQQTENLRR